MAFVRKNRKHYLSKGICPNCRVRPLDCRPYVSCSHCREAMMKWMHEHREEKKAYNKARYEDLKNRGLCVMCKHPSGGNVYCPTCISNKCRTRIHRRPLDSRNRWKVGKP